MKILSKKNVARMIAIAIAATLLVLIALHLSNTLSAYA